MEALNLLTLLIVFFLFGMMLGLWFKKSDNVPVAQPWKPKRTKQRDPDDLGPYSGDSWRGGKANDDELDD